MRRAVVIAGLGSVSLALGTLCGCAFDDWLPFRSNTLPNHVAVDRALHLCSLTAGDQPFRLVLEIYLPQQPGIAATKLPDQDLRAEVEIFWLNPLTYRTFIHSRNFSQTRVVNGGVVEEHTSGNYYPRWIQNFIDAILDPVPHAQALRRVPGSVPIGVQSHACVSTTLPEESKDAPSEAQICFQDQDPKIASDLDFTRYVSFDDFAPFGSQQIARTLVNVLSPDVMVHGRIVRLEPLRQQDYALLKAAEYTPPEQQVQTALVDESTALRLLESSPLKPTSASPDASPLARQSSGVQLLTVYIRTDRTGKVREAYRDRWDHYGLEDAAAARALSLRFRPLLINGIPHQMEAPFEIAMPDTRAGTYPDRAMASRP